MDIDMKAHAEYTTWKTSHMEGRERYVPYHNYEIVDAYWRGHTVEDLADICRITKKEVIRILAKDPEWNDLAQDGYF